jgi:hypothetical protein
MRDSKLSYVQVLVIALCERSDPSYFSAKQKPTVYDGGYVQAAVPAVYQ